MMDEFKKAKAREALQRKWLADIYWKYTEEDVRFKALCRRKAALACVKATGLPYRVAYDLSGAVAPPDAWYPKTTEIGQNPDVRECMRRMMACRRDISGSVIREDQAKWNKLYDRLQERCKTIRGWQKRYDSNWFLCFGHFLIGYAIADFSEFDIFGTVGQHTDAEVHRVIHQLTNGGTE